MSWYNNVRGRGRPRHPDVLTPSEWRVLDELRAGRSNAEIANRLGVSVNTVRTHVSRVLDKLDLRDRHELAAWTGQPAQVPTPRHLGAAPLSWLVSKTAWVAVAAVTVVLVVGFIAAMSSGLLMSPAPESTAGGVASPTPVDNEPTASAVATLTVQSDGVPVRICATESCPVLGTVPIGTSVGVLGALARPVGSDAPAGTWLAVSGLGWLRYDSAVMALSTPTSDLPPVEGDDRRAWAGVHPPDLRTGTAALDAVIEAVVSDDRVALASLMETRIVPCHESGAPGCPEGVPAGTSVEVFQYASCAGEFGYVEDIENYVDGVFDPLRDGYGPQAVRGSESLRLYAVTETGGARPEDGAYRLHFAFAGEAVARTFDVTADGMIATIGYGCGPSPVFFQVPDGSLVLRPPVPAPLVAPDPSP